MLESAYGDPICSLGGVVRDGLKEIFTFHFFFMVWYGMVGI